MPEAVHPVNADSGMAILPGNCLTTQHCLADLVTVLGESLIGLVLFEISF